MLTTLVRHIGSSSVRLHLLSESYGESAAGPADLFPSSLLVELVEFK